MHDGIILLIGIAFGVAGTLSSQWYASSFVAAINRSNIGIPESGSAVQGSVRRPIDDDEVHVVVVDMSVETEVDDLIDDLMA